MLGKLASGASNGIAFLVSAGIVAEIVAKACSSPQTAHLNADKRSPTLMLYVNIGMAEAAVMVAIAAVLDPRHRVPIIWGAITEGVITYGEYFYAKNAGLRDAANGQPGTEDW